MRILKVELKLHYRLMKQLKRAKSKVLSVLVGTIMMSQELIHLIEKLLILMMDLNLQRIWLFKMLLVTLLEAQLG